MAGYPGKRSHGTPESSADAGEDALPPYQVRNVDMLYLEGRLERRSIRSLLPSSLIAAPTRATMIAVYAAPEGWGLAPYTSCYARIAIADHDAPDGSEGMLKLAETASGRAGRLIARHFNRNCETADSWIDPSGKSIHAFGSLGGGAAIEIDATIRSGMAEMTSGAHTELAEGADGGLVSWATAYSTSMLQGDLEALAWRLPQGHRLRALADGFEPTNIWYLFDKSFTLTSPHATSLNGPRMTEVGAAFVDVLGRLKLRVIVLEPNGRPAYVSPEASSLLSGERARTLPLTQSVSFKLLAGSPSDQNARVIGQPVLVTLPGDLRVVVRFLPLSAALWGQRAILCLLTDPGERPISDAGIVLTMMGLTPAEARIARLLSTGVTRPAAARQLGISENTVRSALKSVHAKLDISGRAELASLISRLDLV